MRGRHFDHPLWPIKFNGPDDDPRTWIRLALTIVSYYVGKVKIDSDELVSAALEGVMNACKRDNVLVMSAYVSRCIHTSIAQSITESSVIRIPHRTYTYSGTKPPRQVHLLDVRIPSNENHDLYEEILHCCENETEREIVRLRSMKMVDAEIGEILGFSTQWIHILRKKIEERYEYRRMG